jgi:hypothetical protein
VSTDYKALSRGISRDMSPHAVARRLQIASELYDVATLLRKSRCLGRVEQADANKAVAENNRVAVTESATPQCAHTPSR